jgi:hypothetical protein
MHRVSPGPRLIATFDRSADDHPDFAGLVVGCGAANRIIVSITHWYARLE